MIFFLKGLKFILLIGIFCTSSVIGILISKRYINRLHILKDIKSALNIFEVKLNFSCDTIPEIFIEISKKIKGVAGEIFEDTVDCLGPNDANSILVGEAWERALDKKTDVLKKEDINSLKTLGKLLGKTDIQGQINQIKLVCEFLDKQIEEALEEKNKNEKLYKKLGVIVGLVIVIVLV